MTDTIVALASPALLIANPARGPLPTAMIRLSGSNAAACADAVFQIKAPESPAPPASSIPFRAKNSAPKIPATLVEAVSEKKWRRIAGLVDWRGRALAAHAYVMHSPRSYTREDVIELHVPGLSWLIGDLLDALIAAGARPAQPGEFTRRAYENGRLTIGQAEAVGKLIASSTADEARAHAARLAGQGGKRRRNLKKDLEDLLAQVELGLDFAHEDVVVISREEMAARLHALRDRARNLAEESLRETQRAVSHAPTIVLAGPTNAGKSLLFNTLLKRDASIVSAEPHTTRDAVEMPLTFQNGALSAMVTDSAGSGSCNEMNAEIFSAARQSAQRSLSSAGIILLVLDRSVSFEKQEGFLALLEEIQKRTPAFAAVVWTKCDLPAAENWNKAAAAGFARQTFEVSSLTGQGIEELNAFLASRTAELVSRGAEAHAMADASVRASAQTAAAALERASDALRDSLGEDIVAVELREAIHAFWTADGLVMRHDDVTEAALDAIFAQFCVGK